jgi:ATP:ADP antiporter, AAA family
MALSFGLRPGEARPVGLAFASLFGVTTAHTLIETARDALFLAKVPTTHLPALYLTIAALGVVTSRASVSVGKKKDEPAKLDPAAVSLVGAAAATAAFWFAVASPSRPVLYALYIYSGMFAGWIAGQLWIRFGDLFTVVQAKRLYGLVGTGAILGAVLGAAGARAALAWLPVRHLLLAASVCLVVTALGPVALLPRTEPTSKKAAAAARLVDDVKTVRQHPYLSRLLLLALLASSIATAIDFVFKRYLAETYEPQAMARVIATVSLVLNLASLVAQAAGVRVAVRALGVHRALYVMPLLLALGGAASLGFGMIGVFLLRGFDGALRHSLHKTTTELLFVPLPDTLRSRAKPVIELFGQRGGQAVASVVLLIVGSLIARKAVINDLVAGAVIVLASAWLVLAWTIRPRYLDVFRETLRQGRADLSGEVPELDVGALEALVSALSSRKDAEVLAALDLFADLNRIRLVPSLVLFHPSKTIVLRSLELFVQGEREDFVPVADRLLEHADPEIRAAALRSRAAVDPDPEFLRAHLEAEHDELRTTALVALASRGKLDPAEQRTAFEAYVSSTVEARRALARAIAAVHDPTTHGARAADARAPVEEATAKLARDEDPETRTCAVAAIVALGSPTFGPVLVDLLPDGFVGLAAAEALGAMGDGTVDLLDKTLDRADAAPEAKWRVVHALARSSSERAVEILARRVVRTDDTGLRSRILRALRSVQAGGARIPLGKNDLVVLAEAAITSGAKALSFRIAHARLVKTRLDVEHSPGAELLKSLLRDKEIEAVDRLFLVLSLLHPGEQLGRVQRGLDAPNAKTRASARELLENLLKGTLRDHVLAMVDEVDDETRLSRIGTERTESTYRELLEAMVEQGGELGALAIYHAKEAGLRDSIKEAIAGIDAQGAAFAQAIDALAEEDTR